MRLADRDKIEKRVLKIQDGDFDSSDVELILISLRDYSQQFSIFREAADYVAHPIARKQGLMNESFDAFYLGFRFLTEYHGAEVRLDEPFPPYIKRLLLLNLSRYREAELRAATGFDKHKVRSIINNHIKKVGNGSLVLEIKKVKEKEFSALVFLLQTVKVCPAFSPDDFFCQMLDVFSINKISYDKDKLFAVKDRCILALALMMHKTTYDLSERKKGNCSLGFLGIGEEKYLVVEASVDLEFNGRTVPMVHAIFNTALPIRTSCGASFSFDDEELLAHQLGLDLHLVNDKLEVIERTRVVSPNHGSGDCELSQE